MQSTAKTLDCEARFAPDDAGTFSGYAARFGETNAHGEVVLPGAFAKSIADFKQRGVAVSMLWSHDQSQPIGTWDDIREDATGLFVRGRIVLDTVKGREAHALMKAGAISGLSIGFRNARSTRAASGVQQIADLDLREISLVTIPSAKNARVTSVRAYPGLGGFTEAVRLATAAFKGGQ